MIDIKLIRKNPDIVRENMKKKFQLEKLPLVDEVISLDQKRRILQTESDNLRSERNKVSSQIGLLMKEKKIEEANKIKQKVIKINEKIADNDKISEEIATRINTIMM